MSKDIPSVELPSSEPLGALEPVAFFNGAMPTGVTVSHKGRIFVNFPKWGDDVKFTVSEILGGQPVAYPDQSLNETDQEDQASTLVSVQSVVVDPADRLWILDTGSPLFKPTEYGGPKLVCVNLDTNKVVKKIIFPQTVAQPTTYLNDIRFDLAMHISSFLYRLDIVLSRRIGIPFKMEYYLSQIIYLNITGCAFTRIRNKVYGFTRRSLPLL